MLRRKALTIVLAGVFLLCSMFSVAAPRAEALDITQEDLINLSATIVKIRNLSKVQALQAIEIAESVLDKVGLNGSWLSNEEINRLKEKGLTKSDVYTALDSVKSAVEKNWDNLTSSSASTQLIAAAELINEVVNNLSPQFKNSLKERGITKEDDLGSLITAAMSLVGIQINSWENLPKSEIEQVFNNFISNTSLSKEIVSRYGLNWSNVEEILNSLSDTQKGQLKNILVALGNWPAAPSVVSAATNPAGNQIIITFNKAMANPAGKHSQFTVLVNGAPNAVTAAALHASDAQKIVLTLTSAVAHGNTITVSYTAGTVAAADGGLLESFPAMAVTNNVPVPITTPEVTVDQNTKNLAVTVSTPAATITVPSTVTDATVSVATLLQAPVNQTVTTSALPALTIKAITGISQNPVQVSIPAGATISAAVSDNWDGTINVPTVKENSSVQVVPDTGMTATVTSVIEIGFNDVLLTFDKAVRILIPGQAGKYVGYYRGGTFTKITKVLSSDTQAAGDALPEGGDGRIDVGSDLVIWTKHFTRFVTYTQTKASSPGTGGGGRLFEPEGNTVDAAGGTISDSGAVITFPANAVTETITVKVAKVSDTRGLAIPANSKLVSDVLEITKDKSGNFLKKVTVTLTYDKSLADVEKYEIALYWLDETSNEWIKLDNIKVDPTAGTVSGDIDHFTKFAVFAVEKAEKPVTTLTDIAGHWAADSINRLVQLGAIKGYPDKTFRPDNNITRAEFVTVLVKAFKLAPADGKHFADTIAHWAGKDIATASAYGIISGYDEFTFGPDDLITREQMVVMLVKAAKLAISAEEAKFADAGTISGWARQAVAAATSLGIVKGYPDNTFRPQGKTTRAEAVTVIANSIK